MPVTQIYLIRHGEPDYEPIDSRGWPGMAADSAPLSAVGMKQAEELADILSGVRATYLVSSPFTRALHSAAIIGHRLARSEEHTSELQSRRDLVCRLLL